MVRGLSYRKCINKMTPAFFRPDWKQRVLDCQRKDDCYWPKWWEITVDLTRGEIKGPFTDTLTDFSLILEFVSPRPNANSVSEAPTSSFTGRRSSQIIPVFHFTHIFTQICSFSQQHRHQIQLTKSEMSSATLRNRKTLIFLVETNDKPIFPFILSF